MKSFGRATYGFFFCKVNIFIYSVFGLILNNIMQFINPLPRGFLPPGGHQKSNY